MQRTPAYVGIPAHALRMKEQKASVGVVSLDNSGTAKKKIVIVN